MAEWYPDQGPYSKKKPSAPTKARQPKPTPSDKSKRKPFTYGGYQDTGEL